MKKTASILLCLTIFMSLCSCGTNVDFTAEVKPATEHTLVLNTDVYNQLDL